MDRLAQILSRFDGIDPLVWYEVSKALEEAYYLGGQDALSELGVKRTKEEIATYDA